MSLLPPALTSNAPPEQVDSQLLSVLMHIRPDIPDGVSGRISIFHSAIEAGKTVPVVTFRNAIFMNEQATNTTFAEPLIVRSLAEREQGVWMTDHPTEIWSMRQQFTSVPPKNQKKLTKGWPRGRVLVGGLGLGVASRFLTLNHRTEHIVTVEKSSDIVSLVAPHIENPKHTTVCADLFEYVKAMKKGEFDCAFYDIWQPTGEFAWREYVVPLRRLSRGKISRTGRITCWQEAEMVGQVCQSLSAVAYAKEGIRMDTVYNLFRKVAQRSGITKPTWDHESPLDVRFAAEIDNLNPKLEALIDDFVSPGTEKWERKFGDLWEELVVQQEDFITVAAD